MSTSEVAAAQRVPIRADLLSEPLSPVEDVTLVGSRCAACGETSLGRTRVCASCGRDTIKEIPLSKRGVLWTYTVIRHRPPGNYKGPEPFVPFGLGLVEMPEGLRVMAPIHCDLEKLKIGLELQFKPYIRKDDDGREVVTFTFEPIA